MRFLCNDCNQELQTKHYWAGMTVTCPNCDNATELSYRKGQKIPDTEYSIAFSDFKHLVSYEPYSKKIDPILEKLLNCSVERSESGIKLIAADGSLIPLETAHLEIQHNPSSQRGIYGVAMSLWR